MRRASVSREGYRDSSPKRLCVIFSSSRWGADNERYRPRPNTSSWWSWTIMKWLVGNTFKAETRPLSGLFLKCFVLSLSVCADRSVGWEDQEFRQIGGEHGWFGEKMFKCLIIQTITEFHCPVICLWPPHSGWDDCRLLCSPNILHLRIFPSVVVIIKIFFFLNWYQCFPHSQISHLYL